MIDLSRLPPPDVIAPLDYESILAERKATLLSIDPTLADVMSLESDVSVELLEEASYRELTLIAQTNDAARACMLATAQGADLDNLVAFYEIERLVVSPGDSSAIPPVAPVMESDEKLRLRAQMAPEGMTVAGSRGSYIFHTLSASGRVADAWVDSPSPGVVIVTVLSSDGGGVPDDALIDTVSAYLSADTRRPLTDQVIVEAATVIDYRIEAVLHCYPGPSGEAIRAVSAAAAASYAAECLRLGYDITLSGIYSALHQSGVQRVELLAPAADIVCNSNQAAHCSDISITVGSVNV